MHSLAITLNHPSPLLFQNIFVPVVHLSVLVRPQCPDWVIKRTGVCKSVYGFMHLKEHLGLFEKSGGLSPVLGFYLSSSHRHNFIAVN